MLKNHPKGLIVAFFANMGERFGFYTMMAILVLFLQAKYGLTANIAGGYYSWFYFAIYALALVGGMLADATNRYKTVILLGIVIMFAGYALIAIPGMSLTITLVGLFVIAFGNGLFKGNLQAVVGQMYDDPKYSGFRDTAFMIFYMGINVGAFFAPFVATGVRNWFLKTQGFIHDGSLPAMCHAFLDGRMTDPNAISKFESMASGVSEATVSGASQLAEFANNYINAFSMGYNYAFGVAAGAMVISLLVYIIFNRHLPKKQKAVKTAEAGSFFNAKNLKNIFVSAGLLALTSVAFYFLLDDFALGLAVGVFVGFLAMMFQISTKEELPRIIALFLVFIVVIFFWMSFHQNGLTLTFFARDYTVKEVGRFTNLFFTLPSILVFIVAVAGLILMYDKARKLFSVILTVVLVAAVWAFSTIAHQRGLDIVVARLGWRSVVVIVFVIAAVLFILWKTKTLGRQTVGTLMFIVGGFLSFFYYYGYVDQNPIAPEIFQSFNPLFIVALTFPVMGVFAWLKKRNMEPSTPRKIGIGMIIAALGFVIVLVGSINLVAPKLIESQELTEWGRVSPYWLISSYLVLTIAELFLSPMGLSFVSKVAPVRFQGLMQGGWLLATAIGNKFLFVGSLFWDRVEVWQVWLIFIVCCMASAAFIFSILRRLERATGNAEG